MVNILGDKDLGEAECRIDSLFVIEFGEWLEWRLELLDMGLIVVGLVIPEFGEFLFIK